MKLKSIYLACKWWTSEFIKEKFGRKKDKAAFITIEDKRGTRHDERM